MVEKKKNYYDLLKDPRWQKKRLKIMERDEFMCQSCYNKKKTLNVHHKYYIYNNYPWDYPDGLLITLCESCHEQEESHKAIITDFTKILLSDGYLASELETLLNLLRKLPVGNIGLSFIVEAVKEYEEFNIK